MDRNDRIADAIDAWREQEVSGSRFDIDAMLAASPEIEDSVRAHLRVHELVDQFYDVQLPAEVAAPPPNLGDYRIVREVGRGGMGVVYEAEQVSMGRRVALKVLFPNILSTRSARKRFEREARVTGRLHHTNIVTVYGMGQEAGYLYFAMELVRGEPLDHVIEQLRLLQLGEVPQKLGVADSLQGHAAYRRVAAMFAGAADALHVAHAQGVVHRDVKPSNLVLDEEGVLKLTDFGLAHLAGEGFGVTRTGELVGTPLYMSPEQVRARREDVDLRTDVYSLGVTLYEFLARERPYDGADVGTLCSQILTQEPRPLREVDPHIPRDLATIVHKALEKERGDRYASAGTMAADLRAFAERRPIQARRVGLGRRAWRKVRRHKVRTSLVATVIVLLTAAGVLAARASHEHERRVSEEAQRLDRDYEDLLAKAQTEWPALPNPRDSTSDPLEQAIALRPDRPEGYFVRGMRGEWAGAERPPELRFADLEAAAARGMSARTVHLARAWRFYAYRQTERADREVELALNHAERSPMDALLEAEIARHRGERERAIGLYREVMASQRQTRPLVRRAALQLSRLYEDEGDWDRAFRYLTSASDPDEKPITEALHLASLWDHISGPDKTEQRLEKVIAAVTPGDGLAVWVALLREAQNHCRPTWITRIAEAGVRQHPKAPELHYWRAMGLRRTHQPAEALEVLVAARRFAGDEPSQALGLVHHMRAKALLDVGKVAEAVKDARRAVAMLPSVEGPLVTLCAALMMSGKHAEALAPARRAVELGPGTWWAHEQLAKACMANRDVEGALSAFRAAHEIAPAQAGLARQYAATLTNRGRVDDALAVLDAALKTDSDIELQNLRYWTLEEAGRAEDANAQAKRLLDHSKAVLAGSPDSAPYLALKGMAHEWLGENKTALTAYTASLQLDGSSWKIWFRRAYVHGLLEEPDEERKCYREALRLNPGYASAWGNLGALLSDAGEHKQALEAQAAVLRSTAGVDMLHMAHHNRGMTFIQMKRYDDAVRAFHSALVYRPGDAESLGGIADARYQEGRFEEAAAAYEPAVKADPGSEARWHSWAMSLCLAGRFANALEVLNQGLAKHPKSNDLNAARATVLYRNPQLPGVVAAFEAWVASCPLSRQAWAAKAQLHLGRKEYAQVIECAGKALEIEPDDPSAYETRARAHLANKDYEKALADFEAMLPRAQGYAAGVINFAWFLTTCEDTDLRDPARAVRLADQGIAGLAAEGRPLLHASVMGGWARERAGEPPAEALKMFSEFLRRSETGNPIRGHALYGLASAHARAGEVEKAQAWFEKADAWGEAHPDDKEDLVAFRADAATALQAAKK